MNPLPVSAATKKPILDKELEVEQVDKHTADNDDTQSQPKRPVPLPRKKSLVKSDTDEETTITKPEVSVLVYSGLILTIGGCLLEFLTFRLYSHISHTQWCVGNWLIRADKKFSFSFLLTAYFKILNPKTLNIQ